MSSTNIPRPEEDKRRDEDIADASERAYGWDAITAAFDALYPGQDDPLHFGCLIPWRLGGPDPLQGVSVYDGTKSTAVGYATTEAWRTGKPVKIG